MWRTIDHNYAMVISRCLYKRKIKKRRPTTHSKLPIRIPQDTYNEEFDAKAHLHNPSCCLLLSSHCRRHDEPQNIQYGIQHVYASLYDIFEVIKPASISNNALQLTPDYASPDFDMYMTYNSARILLKQPFKLWDDHAGKTHLASFNTSFLINVYRLRNDTTGEGLAFVIAPDLLLPPNSFGQFLGLTNSITDKSDSNKLVAVEFDTFKQYFDPDDNHVGIDLNSIKSIKTEYLTPHNITIAQ
ncbi:UNVERIFIED_CONTAM: Lectin-related protein [Sesamum angustifolium]|uniref:Lectin-related protein n=1 Tax=Sesamum angustifolium TaxID=2727405 RepID=A0AAW2RQF9_9LAMI